DGPVPNKRTGRVVPLRAGRARGVRPRRDGRGPRLDTGAGDRRVRAGSSRRARRARASRRPGPRSGGTGRSPPAPVLLPDRGGGVGLEFSSATGEKVEGGWVELESRSALLPRWCLEEVWISEGVYDAAGLAPGTYAAVVFPLGYAATRVEGIEVAREARTERQ